jgi:hypothetical protein
MFDDGDWVTLRSYEAMSGRRGIGVRIMVVAPSGLDLKADAIGDAAYRASDIVEQALIEAGHASDPQSLEHQRQNRAQIVGLFDDPIFVSEIPNGYCNRACCRHLPWFRVTTCIGTFEVGWRKRVISIDWNGTIVTKSAAELFPGEDVTKEGRLIHAWSPEKAREYIGRVIDSVQEAVEAVA